MLLKVGSSHPVIFQYTVSRRREKFANMSLNVRSLIRDACLLEARARKPGNVHPEASFEDLCYDDFAQAAEVVADALAEPISSGIGQTVYEAVRGTQRAVENRTNPNLGIVLLLSPLVAVPLGVPLQNGIEPVLTGLTVEDAELVYAAIGLANPGGMGEVESADISTAPTITLREAMHLAADRDSIASEYTTGFQIILQTGVPFLATWPNFESDWENAILHLQFTLMSQFPDTLIARKCGREIAELAASKAQAVLDLGGMQTEPGRRAMRQLDRWLRADGHRRNPGTTADLIAASLFAAGRDGMISLEAARANSDLVLNGERGV